MKPIKWKKTRPGQYISDDGRLRMMHEKNVRCNLASWVVRNRRGEVIAKSETMRRAKYEVEDLRQRHQAEQVMEDLVTYARSTQIEGQVTHASGNAIHVTIDGPATAKRFLDVVGQASLRLLEETQASDQPTAIDAEIEPIHITLTIRQY